MDKEKMKETFWNWVDQEGGDYKVARAMGKQNGTFLAGARKRDSLPKRETLEEMAQFFDSFPVQELLPRFVRKDQSEQPAQPLNPGPATDGYNILVELEKLRAENQWLKKINELLETANTRLERNNDALLAKNGSFSVVRPSSLTVPPVPTIERSAKIISFQQSLNVA